MKLFIYSYLYLFIFIYLYLFIMKFYYLVYANLLLWNYFEIITKLMKF